MIAPFAATKRIAPRLLLGALLALAVTGPRPAAAEGDATRERLGRQTKLMERVIDEVLRESPFFLVYGTEYTHSIYLEEFGVLFTFEASLVRGDMAHELDLSFLRQLRIDSEDGKVTIWRERDEEEGEDSTESEQAEDEYLLRLDEEDLADGDVIEKIKKKAEASAAKRADEIPAEAERYAEGKKELVDALIDYGETLTTLRDDQWVAIAAFLMNSKFFDETKISRLLIKARMNDLRAFGTERIDEEEMRRRVVVEEY